MGVLVLSALALGTKREVGGGQVECKCDSFAAGLQCVCVSHTVAFGWGMCSPCCDGFTTTVLAQVTFLSLRPNGNCSSSQSVTWKEARSRSVALSCRMDCGGC